MELISMKLKFYYFARFRVKIRKLNIITTKKESQKYL